MINPVAWIDQKLLALAASFAKKINWWTGRDNFWIARQCTCFTALCYLGGGLLLPGEMISAVILTLLICPLFFVLTNWTEWNSEEAMLRGAKNIGDDRERCITRIATLIFFCLATYSAIEDAHKYHRYALNGLLVLGSASVTVAGYLIGVDKPPFSRSQAWQWLKGKWADLSFRPQPVPQPVPVRE